MTLAQENLAFESIDDLYPRRQVTWKIGEQIHLPTEASLTEFEDELPDVLDSSIKNNWINRLYTLPKLLKLSLGTRATLADIRLVPIIEAATILKESTQPIINSDNRRGITSRIMTDVNPKIRDRFIGFELTAATRSSAVKGIIQTTIAYAPTPLSMTRRSEKKPLEDPENIKFKKNNHEAYREGLRRYILLPRQVDSNGVDFTYEEVVRDSARRATKAEVQNRRRLILTPMQS